MDFSKTNLRMWSMLGPSGIFGFTMCNLAEHDPNLAVLTADLSNFSGLDRFSKMYPEKFYNLGIAEQNMIGIASGMAKEGMNVFATTYASFASTRVLDQVKVNMGYMNLPVKLIGFTSGYSAGILGATHMAMEDLSILRSIPNITIISPADSAETMKAITAAYELNKPVYIRMSGATRTPIVYNNDYKFEIGKANILKDGTDISIIATGSMVFTSLKVADQLENDGISCEVINMHTIKPLDKDTIKNACSNKLIVTIEEHSKIGGLGAAVAEVLSPMKSKPPHLIIGADDLYLHAASYNKLIERSELSKEKVYNKINMFYKENI